MGPPYSEKQVGKAAGLTLDVDEIVCPHTNSAALT